MKKLVVKPHNVIICHIYAAVWRCTGYKLASFNVRQYSVIQPAGNGRIMLSTARPDRR